MVGELVDSNGLDHRLWVIQDIAHREEDAVGPGQKEQLAEDLRELARLDQEQIRGDLEVLVHIVDLREQEDRLLEEGQASVGDFENQPGVVVGDRVDIV